MARKLRIQFAGAIYHVINRGNYRRDLFVNPSEANAFLATVKEAAERMGWRVHAYAQPSQKSRAKRVRALFVDLSERSDGERSEGVRPIFVS